MSKKFLMVIQRQGASPGRVGSKLEERGYVLDIRYPLQGDMLPEHMKEHAGAVVFGGPMSANDDAVLPGLRAELDWIPTVLESDRPFLGICLGAQLLARSLGARVAPHPEEMAEIGYFEVRPTEAGIGFFEGPLNVYHWHQEGFDLPPDAVLLAAGDCFPHQAFRYGERAYGLQFHPEVTAPIMEMWLANAGHKLTLPGAQPGELHRAGYSRHDPAVGRWLERFLDLWLAPSD